MAVLEPKLAILDETDSGLDIDALKNVAEGVNALRSPDRAFLVITHYQRLLDYITPGRGACAGRRPHRRERRAGACIATGRTWLCMGQGPDRAGGSGLMSALLDSLAAGFDGDAVAPRGTR